MSQAALKSEPFKDQSDLTHIKAKMKATWEDGDYGAFAKYMEAGAVEILHSWDIEPGKRLLDIACGSGQTAIPAAKNGVEVTGIDIASNLIDQARERCRNDLINARFEVGDAEDIPCGDKDFDVAVTMFGAMFAPRPAQVTNELARVLKPGGQLIMANWTPRSMPAQMFKTVAKVVPPAPGLAPPVLWGDEDTVNERLQEDFTDIQLTRKIYPQWHYPFTASELVDYFAQHFGPVKRAFATLEPQQRSGLREQLEEIYASNSETKNGILTITGGEFLQVLATRR